jgi:2'-5' RNA ligase
MRAFIGVDFGKDLKDRIADIQARLRRNSETGRWKYIDNFHLTLKFLDEIDWEKAAAVSRILTEACSEADAFRLNISGIGSFSGRDCLRVLWLGLGGELERLGRLYDAIDGRLLQLGFERERRGFTPHITIGQDVVFKEDFESLKKLADFSKFPEIIIDRLYLFKSEQECGKRIYTPVREFRLGRNR